MGFTSNFASDMAPRGTTSMYIEVSRRPGETSDLPSLERRCIDGLRRSGIMRPADRGVEKLWIPIECGYVVYDRERTPAVRAIQKHLRSRGVWSIGRWGGWKYSFMEETLLDGRRCATWSTGKGGAGAGPSALK